MVNTCAACTKTIRTSMPTIKCSRCNSNFHPMCVNISDRKMTEDLKAGWVCPMCQSKEPRKDNSNTPVRAVASTVCEGENANVAAAARAGRDPGGTAGSGGRKMPTLASSPAIDTCQMDSLSTLTSEIKLLRCDIEEMKTHTIALTDHIKQCFSRLDEYEKKIVDTDSRLLLLEERERETFMCRNTITELRHELSTRAQASLRNEIEISGINEFPEENPMHLLQVISLKIGAALDVNDIDYATRVGPRIREKDGVKNSSDMASKRPPRPLVVRFLRRHNREDFLKAGKSRRNLTCADIGVDGESRNIYINERLTQENRQLFRSARQHAKSADYRFCWIKNGTIYVRKQEGNPAIAIRNMDELQRQFSPS